MTCLCKVPIIKAAITVLTHQRQNTEARLKIKVSPTTKSTWIHLGVHAVSVLEHCPSTFLLVHHQCFFFFFCCHGNSNNRLNVSIHCQSAAAFMINTVSTQGIRQLNWTPIIPLKQTNKVLYKKKKKKNLWPDQWNRIELKVTFQITFYSYLLLKKSSAPFFKVPSLHQTSTNIQQS